MGVKMAAVRTTGFILLYFIFVVLLDFVKGTDAPVIPCRSF